MKFNKFIYFLAIALCILPIIDTPIALLMGIILAQIIQHPFPQNSKKIIQYLLQTSVVGLGFGMNINQAIDAGKQGILFTFFSILTTIFLGILIGKWLKIEKNTSYLISVGTAICGGSAIAAVSSIIKSNEKQISTALGIIFILNSVALFSFPFIGHLFHLSQTQFGIWSAIAIHDTSSVVGAANKFGPIALQIATTIKLERALWIIPISLISIFVFKSKTNKIQIPYFIFLFILAIILNSYIPSIHDYSSNIIFLSKIGLKITLFLIGTGLTKSLINSVGIKPFLQGIIIWAFISVISLVVVIYAYV